MSEGALKPEKDFSKEVDQQLPEAEKLAASKNLQGAIEKLAALEKQTRQVCLAPLLPIPANPNARPPILRRHHEY
ncbi:hypothetical protein CEP54_003053 [Fusarium duplospermum]|uniref:Uncharacterized protein n=1 Tax=Fusarium duplospermum TaxID=1325734 RepID=A0A428QR05_9HYPO|nr:hypothetical protein CEP54_003053 [Fusarium duplospermum]